MRINYTVTTSSCPNCGKNLKIENTLVYLLLIIIFFPLAIIYGIYWYVKTDLEGKLTYVPNVGNPFKICPKCGANVRINDKKLYQELSVDKKYIYDNRDAFQKCYIAKTMAIVFGLTSLLIFSGGELDFTVGCISIPVAIASFIAFKSSKNKCQEIINEAKSKIIFQTESNQTHQTSQNYTPQQKVYQDTIITQNYTTTPKPRDDNHSKTSSNIQNDKPQQSSHFCRICGNKLTEDSVFCSKCGTKIITSNK